MRPDLSLLEHWIPSQGHILDLGCGDGRLLAELMQKKQVTGYGLEIDSANIKACVARGVCVIEQDIDQGLGQFNVDQFDTVIMAQAIQAVHFPDQVLLEMLRVGKEGIVTFPNFGHWKIRWQLAFKGRMPVSKSLPFAWYNTPNIHLCTFKDFEALCVTLGIDILSRCVVDSCYRKQRIQFGFQNLLGETAVYRLARKKQSAINKAVINNESLIKKSLIKRA